MLKKTEMAPVFIKVTGQADKWTAVFHRAQDHGSLETSVPRPSPAPCRKDMGWFPAAPVAALQLPVGDPSTPEVLSSCLTPFDLLYSAPTSHCEGCALGPEKTPES